MHKFTASMLFTMGVLGLGTGIGGAADLKSGKEAKPTLGERLTKHSVTGTLMRIEGEYFSVKDIGGRNVRLHVDQSTKLDKVAVGDKIKAYLTDEGDATTLQRE
jgi:glucokinase